MEFEIRAAFIPSLGHTATPLRREPALKAPRFARDLKRQGAKGVGGGGGPRTNECLFFYGYVVGWLLGTTPGT